MTDEELNARLAKSPYLMVTNMTLKPVRLALRPGVEIELGSHSCVDLAGQARMYGPLDAEDLNRKIATGELVLG